MKKILLTLLLLSAYGIMTSFCGFYVAKADASLFNKASQVILARQGNTTTVTMQSDFEGSVKDFAMVVPVPEVPGEDDIRVVDIDVFNKLDAYSGPRLVEYFDEHPCYSDDWGDEYAEDDWGFGGGADEFGESEEEKERFGVKIEARYSIGEYDILILNASRSKGLEKWLIQEGYNIPKGARDVLEPYIKNDMKFFVVKVNLDSYEKSGSVELRPIQVSYRSEKFMLPIRLGMANGEGTQDMIVYILSDQGRAELTNYRTVDMPSNVNIPTFVDQDFGSFYTKTFTRAWERAGKNVALLEYAWDISGEQPVKCDPCPTPPLVYGDLYKAGSYWIEDLGDWGGGYSGDLFLTRLHVRYDRKHFPQDLQFQLTPNQTRFQARYVLQRPDFEGLECEAGLPYLQEVMVRRNMELKTYTDLTGTVASAETRAYKAEVKNTYSTYFMKSKAADMREEKAEPKRNGSWILLVIAGWLLAVGVARRLRGFL